MMDATKVAAALRWAAESCDGCSRNEVASGSGKCPDCECDKCLERSSAWFNDAADAIERSAMPDGVEWPRFEDGEIVRFGDKVSFGDEGGEVSSIELQDEGYFLLHVCNGAGRCSQRHFSPVERVKRPPVLAADGEPLEVGQTVYGTRDQTPVEVIATHSHEYDGIRTVKCKDVNGCLFYCPEDLTHAKPNLDTWERIEEDATKNPFDYCKDVGHRLDTCENAERFKSRDLVRRARKLAERGE